MAKNAEALMLYSAASCGRQRWVGGFGSCRPPKRFSSSTGHANRAPGLRLPWEWANIWDSPEGPESAAKVAQAGIV